MLSLAKILLKDEGAIMAYYGLKGAGWIIAYARQVLGLPVCTVKFSASSVPISGDYHHARIFVHSFEAEGKCQICGKLDSRSFSRKKR